jgi:hypothetical protein
VSRLLAASSEAASDAFLSTATSLPTLVLNPPTGVLGGELDGAHAPRADARGSRLMALALVANLAARADGAARLVRSHDAHALVDAAARALSATTDTAVCQLGGALSHNLALGLTDVEADASGAPARFELTPPLLTAALGALGAAARSDGALADADSFGRALSVVGHLLGSGGGGEAHDEAVAVALSLDALSTLDALRERAAGLGRATLLERVRALVGGVEVS